MGAPLADDRRSGINIANKSLTCIKSINRVLHPIGRLNVSRRCPRLHMHRAYPFTVNLHRQPTTISTLSRRWTQSWGYGCRYSPRVCPLIPIGCAVACRARGAVAALQQGCSCSSTRSPSTYVLASLLVVWWGAPLTGAQLRARTPMQGNLLHHAINR